MSSKTTAKGLGSPVFDKLEAELAKSMLSLPAGKGFEIGSGFAGTDFTGSEHNDEFYMDEAGNVRTRTNRSGGVQGGISNGEIIYFKVAFKPTTTIGPPPNSPCCSDRLDRRQLPPAPLYPVYHLWRQRLKRRSKKGGDLDGGDTESKLWLWRRAAMTASLTSSQWWRILLWLDPTTGSSHRWRPLDLEAVPVARETGHIAASDASLR